MASAVIGHVTDWDEGVMAYDTCTPWLRVNLSQSELRQRHVKDMPTGWMNCMESRRLVQLADPTLCCCCRKKGSRVFDSKTLSEVFQERELAIISKADITEAQHNAVPVENTQHQTHSHIRSIHHTPHEYLQKQVPFDRIIHLGTSALSQHLAYTSTYRFTNQSSALPVGRPYNQQRPLYTPIILSVHLRSQPYQTTKETDDADVTTHTRSKCEHIIQLTLTFSTFGKSNIPSVSFLPIPSVIRRMDPVLRASMSRIPAPIAIEEAAIFAPLVVHLR